MNRISPQSAATSAFLSAGLWRENPALVQLLGLCPLLAVSTSVVNSLGLGLTTLIVLAGSNLCVSLLRRFLNPALRIPLQIMVIATFVTLADLLLQAFLFALHQRIGLFVALIVTNCVLLARSEAFASRQQPAVALADGVMMGLGFLAVILLLGAMREVLGQGTLFANMELLLGDAGSGLTLHISDTRFLLAILPPGAFILFGFMIAGKNLIDQKIATSKPSVATNNIIVKSGS
ncbi:MAG: electron transport complex subunit E [Pseudomonadales bacterium]|nr:electron transport complex subunit E [Pseudomonadales bacterium]